MSDTLFEITTDHLESGLRGVPVGYCTTSSVDPQKGLHYVGKPISELAHRDPEEVIYLLLNKRFPEESELEAFKQDLRSRQKLDPKVLKSLQALPLHGHPMKWLIHAINALGMVHTTGDYREDCLNLTAQIPTVVAAIFRIREEWGDPIDPDDSLGYMENFVHMLGVPYASAEQNAALTRLMRVFDVVHFDHGGGNLSTFTGKAVASGLADIYESIVGAMCGLAGPRHGKANQECLNFVQELVDVVGGNMNEETVTSLIEQRLANKQLIFGFGHAVLRVEDPRATVLIELGEELCPEDPNFKMVSLLRKVVPEVLGRNPKISNPFPNVDLGSGSLLHAFGLKDSDYYTVLFGMSRVVGIAIQTVYERCEARQGKGTPIIRPKYFYSETGSTVAGEVTTASAG